VEITWRARSAFLDGVASIIIFSDCPASGSDWLIYGLGLSEVTGKGGQAEAP
jgi:hypothetical protein